MSKLIIGTNGFIYKTGRKGEQLAQRFASEFGSEFNLVASGNGWLGWQNKNYDWSEMGKFYQGLNLYVSTSLIEGLGYGVLEALACGIPVVIPKGVGVYDELGYATGIFRYDKGDYDSMVVAIEAAIQAIKANLIEPLELQKAVKPFMSQAWVDTHLKAFEDLLYNSKNYTQNSSINPDLNGLAGVYYVAYGQPAKECFKRALKSVRQFLPEVEVCLVSDEKIKTDEDYIWIEYPDNDIGARGNKTLIYQLAPKEWEFVLYLDSDTEVISSDVVFLFDLLRDGWELVFCTNPSSYALVKDMYRPDNQDEMDNLLEQLGTGDLLQYNGGVFAFRRCANAEKILNAWNKEWFKFGKRDQAALDRVLYANPVKIYTLGIEWNTVTRYYKPDRSAGILHFPMTARRWAGRINGRLDGSEAWGSVHPDNKVKKK